MTTRSQKREAKEILLISGHFELSAVGSNAVENAIFGLSKSTYFHSGNLDEIKTSLW